jgi:hypothetical protein
MARGVRRNADAALLAALAGGSTVADAARAADVSARTVFRRLQDPAFRSELEAARAATIERVGAMLADSATAAVSVLRALLDPVIPPSVRLSAARAILELALRYREVGDLEARVRALEELLGGRDEGGAFRC